MKNNLSKIIVELEFILFIFFNCLFIDINSFKFIIFILSIIIKKFYNNYALIFIS